MAKIDDLLEEVGDAKLRAELRRAVKELRNSRNFGLVFEEHIPEEVALPGLPVRQGSLVQIRTRPDDTTKYEVVSLNGTTAAVRPVGSNDDHTEQIDTADLMVVRRFGEPIYPGLTEVDSIRRGPDSKPAHAVINAENFHALQLLTYTHAGKVDVIYIDPPYNTGARDWKYNNRYVDANDQWRHSKWLSMMDKRLKLSRRLLKPDGVLVVTIDEHEVHHLGVLLEQLFPDMRRQMVTVVINPSGTSSDGLSRVEEYAIFVTPHDREPAPLFDDLLTPPQSSNAPTWESLLRRGSSWYRQSRPNLCYPVLIEPGTYRIIGVGEPHPNIEVDRPTSPIDGKLAAWPVRSDGRLGIWRVEGKRLLELADQGYAYVSSEDPDRGTWTIRYLMSGTISAIERGEIEITGYGDRGQVLLSHDVRPRKKAKTVWNRGPHTAGGAGGTQLLTALLGRRGAFDYPKSVYAVRDTLATYLSDRSTAVVLDFFAGSGTTLHATALMNAQDGGTRQCILVTNNDLAEADQRRALERGDLPGDKDYEALGIFESVTHPRVRAAITGERTDGTKVPGRYLSDYLDADYADGFQENVSFLRLDYLDPDVVGLGRQFKAIAPLLWLAAGAVGEWADREGDEPWSAPPSSNYAVLFDEDRFPDFREMLEKESGRITHVWLVTNSSPSFVEMRAQLPDGLECGMLYRDYLMNFRVNTTEMFI